MGLAYINKEDVRLRLDNTVCLYRDRPFLVHVSGEDPPDVVGISKLSSPGRKVEKVQYTSPDFNYRTLRLGYISITAEKEAGYLTRVPERRAHQGLTHSSSFLMQTDGNLTHLNHNVFFSKDMENCILGKHKSFQDAEEKLISDYEWSAMPFHRHLALARLGFNTLGVYYRTQLIGTKGPNTRGVEFIQGMKSSSYLDRILKSSGVTLQ